MSYEEAIESLESEWALDDGFFWHVRQGHFSPEDFQRTLRKVSALSISDDAVLPRRLVSLLWYIPLFMHWRVERVRESQGDTAEYEKAIGMMTTEIERLLGIP